MTDNATELALAQAEIHNLKVQLNVLSLLLCRQAQRNGGELRFTQEELTNAEVFTLHRVEDSNTGDLVYRAEQVYNITELESAE